MLRLHCHFLHGVMPGSGNPWVDLEQSRDEHSEIEGTHFKSFCLMRIKPFFVGTHFGVNVKFFQAGGSNAGGLGFGLW